MPLACPSCRMPMLAESYAGHYGRPVEIDVCHRCNTLWFDKMESLQLSPGAVVKLITAMHERHAAARQVLGEVLACPRCPSTLRRSERRTTTLTYTVHACPDEHGHLVTFYDFLREKDCIRPLRGEKLKALREQVSSVACSACGAPVDLHRTTICGHCQAPLVLLDPDAMAETLARLQASADRRAAPDPDAVAADMVLARLQTERTFREQERIAGSGGGWGGLLEAAAAAVARLLGR